MPGGRPKNSAFNELGFVLEKQNKKYVAICSMCNRKLSNTASSRLRAHRNVCKLATSSTDAVSDTIAFIIDDNANEVSESLVNLGDQDIFVVEKDNTVIQEQDQMNVSMLSETEDSSFRPVVISSQKGVQHFASEMNPPSTSSVSPLSSLNVSRMQLSSTSSFCSSSPSVRNIRPSSSGHKKKDTKISAYMDKLSLKEEEDINDALARFIFGCNLPLNVVESQYFKKFINKIRPAYHEKIPSRKLLSSTLLDKTYENCIASNKKVIGKESVLLIDGWKNSSSNSKTVVSMIHNASGEQAFINAWDLSGEVENAEKLADIVYDSMDIAKDIYSTEIYAVVSDNASTMMKMGRLSNHVVWHSTCNSHTANLLAKDVVDKDLNIKVISIQKEFKQSDLERAIIDKGGHRVKLPCETRWCSYRDCYANFIYNLQSMKLCAADRNLKNLKPSIAKLLFEEEFIEGVNEAIKIFDPICHLINTCQKKDCSLADAVDLWLKLELPERFNDKLEKRKKMAFNVYALTAFYLHPFYDSKKLQGEYMDKVNHFLFVHLNSKGIEDWDAYRNSRGFFKDLYDKGEMNPLVFWNIAEMKHPQLSFLAKRLMNLPASTAQIERMFSNWAHVHSPIRNRLTFERSKKLLNVYYSLRLADDDTEDDDEENSRR